MSKDTNLSENVSRPEWVAERILGAANANIRDHVSLIVDLLRKWARGEINDKLFSSVLTQRLDTLQSMVQPARIVDICDKIVELFDPFYGKGR